MVNPKQHDSVAFEMLNFSVLNFYFLQASGFFKKNGFVTWFLMKTLKTSQIVFQSQRQIEQALSE